jgi:hypothetical protein
LGLLILRENNLNCNALFFKKPFGLGDGDGKVAWPEIVRKSQGRF